jgi:hypothetical protein
MKPTRILAIDWSGATSATSQRKHIVAAEVDIAHIAADSCACRELNVGNSNISACSCSYPAENVDASNIWLHSGLTRQELIDWLCKNAASRLQSAVIGFDFSFSLPASFLREHHCSSVFDLWELVAWEGEGWLRDSPEPFWGRPGRRRPELAPEDALRRSERQINVHGILPKSTFQTGGAGAAGTGSLRGMPLLLQLRRAGFSIWPFDPPRLPMVVEIYPRLLTGPVVKSSREARLRYLAYRGSPPGSAGEAVIV